MMIKFILLILVPQLLTWVTNAVSSDYSVDILFGDSFCQNIIQQDVTNAVKNVCTAASKVAAISNEQYKVMATRTETLERKLDGALQKSASISSNPCRFGYEYFKQESFCYRFHKECVPWSEARQVCQQEGGDLIILKETNFNFIRDVARSQANECSHVWVGTTDISTPGQWRWLNGESISQTLWATNQPDNENQIEHCGDLQQWYDYKLNDENCSNKMNFICQILL